MGTNENCGEWDFSETVNGVNRVLPFWGWFEKFDVQLLLQNACNTAVKPSENLLPALSNISFLCNRDKLICKHVSASIYCFEVDLYF